MRQCNLCEFKVDLADAPEELKQMADHLAIHNPTPEQWRHAYNKILQTKEKLRKQSL